MTKKEEDIYNEDMFRLALSNSIYHSISGEVYKEIGCRLPVMFMFYIEGRVRNEDIKNYIKLTGDIW